MKAKNMNIIHGIILIFVIILSNACKDTKHSETEPPEDFHKKYIPLYEIEFAKQLGIDTKKLKNPMYSYMEIGDLCNQIGAEKILENAKTSKDPFTLQKYFLINETSNGFTIEKIYPLDINYIIITLVIIRKDRSLKSLGLSYTTVQGNIPLEYNFP